MKERIEHERRIALLIDFENIAIGVEKGNKKVAVQPILDRLLQDVSEIGVMEQEPLQEGRNMSMLLAPMRVKGTDAERSAA